MRAIGIHRPELVSWIEGNVASNLKVLLVVDPRSGVNLFGMALAYYLRTSSKGRLDMLIRD